MEEKQISSYEDEINLIDIFKTIWRYRVFLLVFILIFCVIAFLYFNFSQKTSEDNNFIKQSYILSFNFPVFTYEDFYAIKLNIKYDLNNKYFKDKYNIVSIKLLIINKIDGKIIEENNISLRISQIMVFLYK